MCFESRATAASRDEAPVVRVFLNLSLTTLSETLAEVSKVTLGTSFRSWYSTLKCFLRSTVKTTPSFFRPFLTVASVILTCKAGQRGQASSGIRRRRGRQGCHHVGRGNLRDLGSQRTQIPLFRYKYWIKCTDRPSKSHAQAPKHPSRAPIRREVEFRAHGGLFPVDIAKMDPSMKTGNGIHPSLGRIAAGSQRRKRSRSRSRFWPV